MFDTPREIVINFPPPKARPHGVINCPKCGGTGRDNESGSACFSARQAVIRPARFCGMCRGLRLVKVTPYDEFADETA